MTEDTPTWHLYPVAILAILWNLAGCVDYVITQYGIEPFLTLFTQAQADYFTSFPSWIDGIWAMAVWGGLLGAVLLFFRSGAAPWILALAMGAMAVLAVWMLGIATPRVTEVVGPMAAYMLPAAVAVAAVFYLYARSLRVEGALV
ncbi:hypothetical protein C8N32_105159 [Rhodovulum imhoffii]|uniref:DoxX-like protein n=1 Tax=Rhodovulum imhoffii TaxID=365340 RepID=A0A2T5BTN0_9RHOB|nr:hypothetical protein [Rhodovulum imhoffii]MBK5934140.1 hypothetical protein [Rhodovulum imhoffii]PTN02786.1 hypothetical protein C8N32_105159 [Rhodovulum imhoffii]